MFVRISLLLLLGCKADDNDPFGVDSLIEKLRTLQTLYRDMESNLSIKQGLANFVTGAIDKLEGDPENDSPPETPFDLQAWHISADNKISELNSTSLFGVAPTPKASFCEGCSVPLDQRDLFHYGCWCNFENRVLIGKSQPLDEFDERCRELQLCFRCTIHDNGGDLTNCDPDVNQYNIPFFFFFGIEQSCIVANPTNVCSQRFCMCHHHYTGRILDLSFEGFGIDPELKHESESFDYSESCTTGVSQRGSPQLSRGEADDACCGEYPQRYPYNRERFNCCTEDGTIYNPNTAICCSFGVSTTTTC